jgi:YHS domain-containing protein
MILMKRLCSLMAAKEDVMVMRQAEIWVIRILIAAGLTMSFAACTSAKGPINAKNGIAIKGYDTVAYFTEGKPVKGKEEFSLEWKGAKWLFSSREHLELFEKSPEKYAPQYGGY